MKPQILYYNTHLIPKLIRMREEWLPPFLSEHYSDHLLDQYDRFGLNKHNTVYDRTGHLPHYLNMDPKHTMPGKVDGFNKTFWEITVNRAKELLSIGKPINVLWSGGLDSTYILFVLKHFANDPEQVRVFGTYNSIIESGDLFDRRIKKEFMHTIKVGTSNDFTYTQDTLYVSGMCGNQLFGPADDFFSNTPNALFHHTLGTPETIYKPYKDHIDPNLLEFLDPMIKHSPRKLETVADLRWYCIFNLDWYTGLYEHKPLVGKTNAIKMQGFFDSWDFQTWAVNTKDAFTKVPGNPQTHRWQMREVLDEMFGETHFAHNKPKKISTFTIPEPHWLFLFSDLRTYTMRPHQSNW